MSSLQNFLTNFNTTNHNVHKIDSLNTFTAQFTNFSPPTSNVLEISRANLNNIFDVYDSKFHYYIQSVSMPDFTISESDAASTLAGSFKTHTFSLIPSSQELRLQILNTKVPIIENFFLPWLQEIQSPQWIYDNVPYTKATFSIDLRSHCNVSYVFLGCRPTSIGSYSPSQELVSNISRSVTLTFDLMYVKCDNSLLKNKDKSLTSALKSLGKTVGIL